MSTEPRDTPIAQHEGLVTTTLPSRLFHQPALTGEHESAAKRKVAPVRLLGNALWDMLCSLFTSKGGVDFVTGIIFSGELLSIMLIAFVDARAIRVFMAHGRDGGLVGGIVTLTALAEVLADHVGVTWINTQ